MMHRTRNYLTALPVALALVLGVAMPAAAVSSGIEKNGSRAADGIVLSRRRRTRTGAAAHVERRRARRLGPLLVLLFVLRATSHSATNNVLLFCDLRGLSWCGLARCEV